MPDPSDDLRTSALSEFLANNRLGFSEAVAEKPRASRLLMPDGHPDVLSAEAVTSVAEIHT